VEKCVSGDRERVRAPIGSETERGDPVPGAAASHAYEALEPTPRPSHERVRESRSGWVPTRRRRFSDSAFFHYLNCQHTAVRFPSSRTSRLDTHQLFPPSSPSRQVKHGSFQVVLFGIHAFWHDVLFVRVQPEKRRASRFLRLEFNRFALFRLRAVFVNPQTLQKQRAGLVEIRLRASEVT
jgi:hypothetical protein